MEKSCDSDATGVDRCAQFLITNDCATAQMDCCSVDSVLIFEGVFRNAANEQEQIGGNRADMRRVNRGFDRGCALTKNSIACLNSSAPLSRADRVQKFLRRCAEAHAASLFHGQTRVVRLERFDVDQRACTVLSGDNLATGDKARQRTLAD